MTSVKLCAPKQQGPDSLNLGASGLISATNITSQCTNAHDRPAQKDMDEARPLCEFQQDSWTSGSPEFAS